MEDGGHPEIVSRVQALRGVSGTRVHDGWRAP